jgi:hypothetical protein
MHDGLAGLGRLERLELLRAGRVVGLLVEAVDPGVLTSLNLS